MRYMSPSPAHKHRARQAARLRHHVACRDCGRRRSPDAWAVAAVAVAGGGSGRRRHDLPTHVVGRGRDARFPTWAVADVRHCYILSSLCAGGCAHWWVCVHCTVGQTGATTSTSAEGASDVEQRLREYVDSRVNGLGAGLGARIDDVVKDMAALRAELQQHTDDQDRSREM